VSQDIKPFQIAVPENQLEDLKTRLSLTRWPEKECVDDWSQGSPLSAVKNLCDYWLNHYDWRRCENHLNSYPQFTTEIDGLDIHFLHIRSTHENARPLIMTHGWPGSVLEFMDVIEPLTQPEKFGGDPSDAFHLVLPSLPGFGFSGKPSTTGWGIQKTARAWDELMARLGYTDYFAQGGDWGSAVTTMIGKQNLPGCRGIHLNLVLLQPDIGPDDELTEEEQSALQALQFYADWDSGYSKQQATRPQTIGYSLVDSPAGLAAWIYEKFYFWTDNQGSPESAVPIDHILDNIMIYWLNQTGASAARLYWESFNTYDPSEVTVPTGISVFPKEIFRASQRWAEKHYKNIVFWSYADKGGHFAAFEQPELFVSELTDCFKEMTLKP
jgi:pimeloyl-ACP methyl ester carboxylesterase